MIRGCCCCSIAVPLLLRARACGRRRRRLRYPVLDAVRAVGPGRPRALALAAAGHARRRRWSCWSLALARPQLGKAATQIYTEGIDIMLAVDISGSMLSEDFQVDGQRANRLEAVKAVVRKFLDRRPGDRVGLVVVRRRGPYTQSPLTLDHGWLMQNLERAPDRHDRGRHRGRLGRSPRRSTGWSCRTRRARSCILLTDGAEQRRQGAAD